MSAPAGWHLQPDGQERYWDGQQWTEHFRMPLALDPTAPPEWAPAAQDTQVLDVSHTTAIPATDPLSDPYAATGEASPYPPARAGSAAPESGYGAVPPGYPATPSGVETYAVPNPTHLAAVWLLPQLLLVLVRQVAHQRQAINPPVRSRTLQPNKQCGA